MAVKPMTEIEAFRNTFAKEYRTTRRVLHAYPPDQAGLKPARESKSAKDLAWMLTVSQLVIVPALEKTELSAAGLPKQPETWADILVLFDEAHEDAAGRLARATEAEWETEVSMLVAPKQIGTMLRGQTMWLFLYDTIHHRGQLSVYLRMAGGKLPSIYGPTADEPWH